MRCRQIKPVLRQCPAVIFCKRRGKLIDRLIAEIQLAAGCVVQLRTLHIVKISSRRRIKNYSPRPRLCMEDFYPQEGGKMRKRGWLTRAFPFSGPHACLDNPAPFEVII